MKQYANCYCEKLANILKDCLKENRFLNLMKVAEMSPVFKKLNKRQLQRQLPPEASTVKYVI